jgi:hypothetical protein
MKVDLVINLFWRLYQLFPLARIITIRFKRFVLSAKLRTMAPASLNLVVWLIIWRDKR